LEIGDAKFVCFLINLQVMSSAEDNGYGGADAQMTEIGNAADFSYASSTTTGFKVRHSLFTAHDRHQGLAYGAD